MVDSQEASLSSEQCIYPQYHKWTKATDKSYIQMGHQENSSSHFRLMQEFKMTNGSVGLEECTCWQEFPRCSLDPAMCKMFLSTHRIRSQLHQTLSFKVNTKNTQLLLKLQNVCPHPHLRCTCRLAQIKTVASQSTHKSLVSTVSCSMARSQRSFHKTTANRKIEGTVECNASLLLNHFLFQARDSFGVTDELARMSSHQRRPVS